MVWLTGVRNDYRVFQGNRDIAGWILTTTIPSHHLLLAEERY